MAIEIFGESQSIARGFQRAGADLNRAFIPPAVKPGILLREVGHLAERMELVPCHHARLSAFGLGLTKRVEYQQASS